MSAIDFEKVRNVLKRWFEHATGGLQVVFQEEPRPFVDPVKGAFGLLNVLSIAPLGVDETRVALDLSAPIGQECVPTLTGLRRMTISCQVESFSQEPNESARSYLECARSRLRTAFAKHLFCQVNMALIDAQPTLNLDYMVDERMRSRGAFDVRFGIAACMLDEPLGSIASVAIKSNTLNDDGGNPTIVQIDEVLTLP